MSDARAFPTFRRTFIGRPADPDRRLGPQNANGHFRGPTSLRNVFAQSINTVAAQLADEVGIPAVIEMARRLGIESELPAVPSLALGAAAVILREILRGGRSDLFRRRESSLAACWPLLEALWTGECRHGACYPCLSLPFGSKATHQGGPLLRGQTTHCSEAKRVRLRSGIELIAVGSSGMYTWHESLGTRSIAGWMRLTERIIAKRQFAGDAVCYRDPRFMGEWPVHYLAPVKKLETLAQDRFSKSVLAPATRWVLDECHCPLGCAPAGLA